MLSGADHDALASRLYAAAVGDETWSSALGHIAGSFGSSKALTQVLSSSGNLTGFGMHGYSLSYAADFYASEPYRRDPRVPFFQSVRPGMVYYDRVLFDVEKMRRDPRCRECSDALGVEYSLGALTMMPDGSKASLALMSTTGEGQHSDETVADFQRLSFHISQSFAIGQVFEQQAATRDALLAALSAKGEGIILLDGAGVLHFANDFARGILAAGDGLAYSTGSFTASRGPETRRLQSMIADALAQPAGLGSGGRMLVSRPSGLRPYVLSLIVAPPMERFLSGRSIGCIIHLQDLAVSRPPSRGDLIALFGLTERESDLAVELVRCAGLQQAAAHARMSINTARNHLQSIFRKSGTANQTEAVQLFSRLS